MVLPECPKGVTLDKGARDSYMDKKTNVCLNLFGLEMPMNFLLATGVAGRLSQFFRDICQAMGRSLPEFRPMSSRSSIRASVSRALVAAAVFSLLSVGTSKGGLAQTSAPAKANDAEAERFVDELLAKMTLEEKIGQMSQI